MATPPQPNILSLENVSLTLGDRRVLDDLTFTVRRGETFGFLGPSGAGKTTTIKLLTRQLVKDTGRINLFGRPIEHACDADYERVGILSDTSALYERLSIEDNLRLYARLRNVRRAGIPQLLKRLKLWDERKTLIKNCSKGMRQRATLVAALIHDPELLFLDEPTSGLDPAARSEVHAMLNELQKRGVTVFITTHDMAEADTLCDRVGILNEGTLVACDAPLALKLAHARNRVVVRTRTQGEVVTTKDSAGAQTVSALMTAGECLSLHSDKPNLEEVFLELTGREL